MRGTTQARTPQTALRLDRPTVLLLDLLATELLTTRSACLVALIEHACRELGICPEVIEAAAWRRKVALVRLV